MSDLSAMLRPRSIALVGASDNSGWSQRVIRNFTRLPDGVSLHLVNRRGAEAHGRAAVRSIAEIGGPVDVAYIFVPAEGVAAAIQDCATSGVKAAIVLTSGFAEAGGAGRILQQQLVADSQASGMRLLGPNSLGFHNYRDGIAVSPIGFDGIAPAGGAGIGLISQSGAIMTNLISFGRQQAMALTYAVAVGNEADVDVGAVTEFLLDDDATRVVAIFAESIRDPQAFLRAAEHARSVRKPIVIFKVGTSELTAAVAQAHTGSMVGDNRVFDAICRQYGIIRAESCEDLMLTAELLARIGVPDRPGLAVVSISGGTCEMIADKAEPLGLSLPAFAPETLAMLGDVVADFGATFNPLDITGAAVKDPTMFRRALAAVAQDPNVGLVAAVADIPGAEGGGLNMPMLHEIAAGLRAAPTPGPLITTTLQPVTPYMQGIIAETGLPFVIGGVDHAVAALGKVMRWAGWIREGKPRLSRAATPTPPTQRPVTERETLSYLATHDVPVIPAEIAHSADEAQAIAGRLAGRLVMKILSADIAHKTDVGGVMLDVDGPQAARAAYDRILQSVQTAKPDARIEGVIMSPMRGRGVELFVGIARDPQWGLALVVGLGGIWVELMKDSALRVLPVTPGEVREMLGELRAGPLLRGFRGSQAVDLDAVAEAVSRIGDASLALGPDLESLEINPLWVDGSQVEALDGLAIWRDGEA